MRFEYHNNKLCVEAGWLFEQGIISKSNLDILKHRQIIRFERRACKNTPALVEYKSIPERFKDVIMEKYGNPYDKVKHNRFTDHINPDAKLKAKFEDYTTAKGKYLKPKQILTYYTNSIILDALHRVANDRIAFIKACGGRYTHVWPQLSQVVNRLDTERYPHSLPGNHRRLKQLVDRYINEGYNALIHGNQGNDNSRKVNDKIERLLMSIYAMETRPFASWVQEDYLSFLSGQKDIPDFETGELMNREDYFDDNGTPIVISESTAWAYLNRPDNKAILDKVRKSGIDFKTKTMPFNHRHRPNFSLSKVSFDDRTAPRKSVDGTWVQSYVAYDPMSECFVGWAHSKEKDMALVYDCFRSMYHFLNSHGLPWPAEAEVERHLMSSISDQLHAMFAFVRECNPQNSREKRAEHGIRLKKYGTEKRSQKNIGRWSNKHDAYQVNEDFTEKLTRDQIIADDIQSFVDHNNKLHSKQDLYYKKTRLQVLIENVNPELSKPQSRIISRYIGFKTETSIRNNDYCRVQYSDYAIDTINILARLKPNNYSVDAYYIPQPDGNINKVYLFQDDNFLCQASRYETYNEALAERTERDEHIRVEQAKRQAHFRNFVKEGVEKKIAKVDVVDPYDFSEQESKPVEVVHDLQDDPFENIEFETNSKSVVQRAIDNL